MSRQMIKYEPNVITLSLKAHVHSKILWSNLVKY